MLTKEMDRARFDECKRILQIVPATCATTFQTMTLICNSGVCSPPSIALPLITKPPPKILKPGVDALIVDSGAGQHIVDRDSVASEKHLTHCGTGMRLRTANGIVETHLKTKVFLKHLGIKVIAWVLNNTPNLLSIGKLVEDHGCDFTWDHRSKKTTLTKDGKRIVLGTVNNVPYLPIR